MVKIQGFSSLFILIIMFSTNSISLAHSDGKPRVMSEAAILMEAKSGEILFNKNVGKQMYPASITKILTGIIAIEEGELTDVVSVSKEATEVDGTRVYLVENEKIELKRLVQGLLINSGNDAGIAIAEHIAGSEPGFAAKMNQFVKTNIGVHDSHFTNPHGLFDDHHYTTAYDMAKISQYAMKNEIFKEIVGTKKLEWDGMEWDTTIYNHHQLVRADDEVTGIKNGYVSQSGYTLVTSAERDHLELIAVTLKAPTSQQAYDDTTKLFNYGFENFVTEEWQAGETFTDHVGAQYTLESDTFVTVRKGDNVTTDIYNDSLMIKNEDGKILSQEKLASEEIEEFTKDEIEKDVSGTQKSQWFQRLLHPLINGLFDVDAT